MIRIAVGLMLLLALLCGLILVGCAATKESEVIGAWEESEQGICLIFRSDGTGATFNPQDGSELNFKWLIEGGRLKIALTNEFGKIQEIGGPYARVGDFLTIHHPEEEKPWQYSRIGDEHTVIRTVGERPPKPKKIIMTPQGAVDADTGELIDYRRGSRGGRRTDQERRALDNAFNAQAESALRAGRAARSSRGR